MFTRRIGDRYAGVEGLSLTIPIAAATAAIVGVPQAVGHLGGSVLVAALGLALLLPVIPFALEMLALRHMTTTAAQRSARHQPRLRDPSPIRRRPAWFELRLAMPIVR